MSRVGIMTFLRNGNYGSSLQAYALQRVVRGMGHEAETIDYQPDNVEKTRNMIRCGNSARLITDGRRKRQVKAGQSGMQEKYQRIQDFYDRRMKLSPVCHNGRDLKNLSGRYDILLCGSDQIWNPVWLNPAYFLDFAEPEKTRVAYAPSLGVVNVPNRRKQRIMKDRLALFDAVSVREEEGAKILVTLTGDRPPVLPDPVCLLTREEWMEIAAPAPEGEPYLLCYFIGENMAYWDRVRTLQNRTGLRPLVIPVTAGSYEQTIGELLDGAGPEEFLGAVAGAEMICTDSFHGLAFGTIFKKKVDVIRRYREDDPESKNSRIDHFLRENKSRGIAPMREDGLWWLRKHLREE